MSDRKLISVILVCCAAAFALALSGCTTAYTTAAASLVTAERVVQAASEQFPAAVEAKRFAIVKDAKTYDAGKVELDKFNAKVDEYAKAIEGAHASVRLGADGLKGVRDGLRDPKQLGAWITPAIRVGVDLLALLKAAGINIKVGGN